MDTESSLFFTHILLLLPLLLALLFKQLTSPKKMSSLPPGPFPWPIVGNLFQMGKDLPHVTFANLAKIHGPLMSLRLGSQLVIIGTSPAAATEILKTHDRLLSGRPVASALKVEGSKFHMSIGFREECDDYWKSLRTIYRRELFSSKAMECGVKLREQKVTEMLKCVRAKEGEEIEIRQIVFATFLNILSNTFLSVDFTDFEGNGIGEGMSGDIRRFNVLGGTPQLADLFPIFRGWDLQNFYKKLVDIYERMCATWVDLVKERREGRVMDDSSPRDFTDALIENGFTDDQINNIFQELFCAATESTTATTEWMLVELLRNQQALKKLRDELTQIGGRDMVRESYLPHLPYLEACYKETLRLHPPGPLLLPHRAIETCEVMGYTIPKDSILLVNMWAIARDPLIWEDPLSFKPERFLASGMDYKGQDFEYIPFSSGRKICPGQPLASRAVSLIVASLVHSFDWELPENMDPANIDMSSMLDITMQKKEPLCIIPRLCRQYLA